MKTITIEVPDDCPEIPQGSTLVWFAPDGEMPEVCDTRSDIHGAEMAPTYVLLGYATWGFACEYPQLVLDWHAADMHRHIERSRLTQGSA